VKSAASSRRGQRRDWAAGFGPRDVLNHATRLRTKHVTTTLSDCLGRPTPSTVPDQAGAAPDFTHRL